MAANRSPPLLDEQVGKREDYTTLKENGEKKKFKLPEDYFFNRITVLFCLFVDDSELALIFLYLLIDSDFASLTLSRNSHP